MSSREVCRRSNLAKPLSLAADGGDCGGAGCGRSGGCGGSGDGSGGEIMEFSGVAFAGAAALLAIVRLEHHRHTVGAGDLCYRGQRRLHTGCGGYEERGSKNKKKWMYRDMR